MLFGTLLAAALAVLCSNLHFVSEVGEERHHAFYRPCTLACPCCHPMPEARPIPDYRVARTAAFLHARRCLVPVVALSFSNVDSLFIVQRTKCEDIARNRLIELARTKKSARPCLPRASVGTARVGVVHFVG